MARTIRTIEAVASSTGMEVDRDAGIIHGVKILGLVSDNNRKYMPEAVRKAKSLYEGIKVNIDHPAESGDVRSAEDRFGKLINVKYVEGEGLYGDLMFLKSHPMAERICEAAERNDMNDTFGLSHNAQGDGQEDDDGCFVVSSIVEVRHVDLVADPATTKSLREARTHIKTINSKESVYGDDEEDEDEEGKRYRSQYANKYSGKHVKKDELMRLVKDGRIEANSDIMPRRSVEFQDLRTKERFFVFVEEAKSIRTRMKAKVTEGSDQSRKSLSSMTTSRLKELLWNQFSQGLKKNDYDKINSRRQEFVNKYNAMSKEKLVDELIKSEGWKESDMRNDGDEEMTEATNFDDKQLDWIRKNVYDASKMGKVKTLAKTAQAAISEINKWLMGANQNHSGPKTAATFGHYRDALTSVPVNSTLYGLANLDPSKYINNDAFSESKSKIREAEDMPVEDPSEEEKMTEEDDMPMEDPSEEEEMTESSQISTSIVNLEKQFENAVKQLHSINAGVSGFIKSNDVGPKTKQKFTQIRSDLSNAINVANKVKTQLVYMLHPAADGSDNFSEAEGDPEDDMPMGEADDMSIDDITDKPTVEAYDEEDDMPMDEADDEYTDDEDKMAMESKQYRKLQQFCKKNNVAFTKDLYKDLKPLTETAQQRCVLRIKLAAKARKPKSSGSIMPMTESKVHTGDNVFNWLRS